MRLSNDPIGFFDSGIGGLSVLQHVSNGLPCENLLYFADSGHAPYGDKTEAFVIERSFAIVKWLLDRRIKALVVACNTATAAAIAQLRERYPNLPIVGVEPGVKPAIQATKTGVVGIMATQRTIDSEKFHRLCKNLTSHTDVKLIMQPCHGLADLIETAQIDSPAVRQCVSRYLLPLLNEQADTIVLGCTHYPFVKHIIMDIAQNTGHKISLIDTGEAIKRQLEYLLVQHNIKNEQSPQSRTLQVHTTGNIHTIESLIKRLLDIDVCANARSIENIPEIQYDEKISSIA